MIPAKSAASTLPPDAMMPRTRPCVSIFPASTAANPTAPPKEVREKMATLHEQMAACLRSDKPLADCHSEMMKSCQDTMGKKDCPMMGHGMMGSGSGKRAHMMQDGAKNPEDRK